MQFNRTPLEEAYLIEPQPLSDDRGFFSRIFCSEELKKEGLEPSIFQINNSYSSSKGTLRGMHYQLAPKEETKIVRCILGSIYDVILDLRPDSSTFGEWYGTELTAENRKMMYVPKGFAHGFITLTDKSEVIYFVSENYSKEHERGVRWDDPQFEIQWPMEPQVISEKDRMHPDFNSAHHLVGTRR